MASCQSSSVMMPRCGIAFSFPVLGTSYPFLSLLLELIPPHPLFVINVRGVHRCERTHAFSKRLKKENLLSRTSAYIFLGCATLKKSRGRSISSLLSTQVAKKIRYQVRVWRSKCEESEHFVVKGLVKLWPRSLSAAWAGSF